jgi:hypothetical protein
VHKKYVILASKEDEYYSESSNGAVNVFLKKGTVKSLLNKKLLKLSNSISISVDNYVFLS